TRATARLRTWAFSGAWAAIQNVSAAHAPEKAPSGGDGGLEPGARSRSGLTRPWLERSGPGAGRVGSGRGGESATPTRPGPTRASRAHEHVRRDGFRIHGPELDLALEIADDRRPHVDLVEIVDVGDPARREDVDLENLVAHQVDADEVEPVGHQAGLQEIADPTLGFREVGAPPRAAHVDVVPDVVLGAHSLVGGDDAAHRQRRAAQQEDALVPF